MEKQNAVLRKKGCQLAKQGTMEGFKEAIRKFSEIKKPTADILYLRGNAYLKFGDVNYSQKAVDDFTEAISLLSKKDSSGNGLIPQLYYKRAFAYQMLGENGQAIDNYSLFIENVQDCGDEMLAKGYLSRGLVYESMQQMKKASADIDYAVKLTPVNNPYYEYCQARVRIAMFENSNDPDEDTHHHDREDENKMSMNVSEKINHSEKHTVQDEKQPNSMIKSETPNARYEKSFYKALMYSERRENRKALEQLNDAYDKAINNNQRADCLFRQGLFHYNLGEKIEAQNKFKEALKYNREHARAIFRLGMMQAADRHWEDALKSLNSAHNYAPAHIDILHERANVLEKMGKVNEAMYDRSRAMNLMQWTPTTIVVLEDRIRHLKAEILQTGDSAISHLKIGWMRQTLHKIYKRATCSNEKDGKTNGEPKRDNSMYEEAVKEYKAAIDIDKKHVYPEARALLTLCQEQEEDILAAHDILQDLFDLFEKFPKSVKMWKSFIQKLYDYDTSYWYEMGSPPPETSIIKLEVIEKTRQAIKTDEERFNKNQNLLLFYHTCRIQLSNVLVAFALAGCTGDVIKHNIQGPRST